MTKNLVAAKISAMNLKTYLTKTNKNYKDLATDLGKHPVYINGVVSGVIKPGPKLVLAICEWTRNAIRPHELRPDLWRK